MLDVPPPAAGEGSRWRLELTPFLYSVAADPWLAGTLAVAAAALVYAVHRREGRTLHRRPRMVMTGLRVCLLLLVLAVLLPQVRLWFERQGWPDVVLLIDDSQSMSAT